MSTTSCGINENGTLTKDRAKIGHIGDIIAFYGSTAPEGTLVCNGAAISRTTYSELFGVIGTTAGAGDGSTTFNLPDLRGLFLRGLNGANAAALGVEQGDAIRNLQGNVMLRAGAGDAGIAVSVANGVFVYIEDVQTSAFYPTAVTSVPQTSALIRFNSSASVPTATENRPVNTAVLYCMIYE